MDFAHAHVAELRLRPGADPRAPGGAVTVALCGHWDHEGPCRWPHHSAIDTSSRPARFCTRFDASPEDERTVRMLIEQALRASSDWTVVTCDPADPADQLPTGDCPD